MMKKAFPLIILFMLALNSPAQVPKPHNIPGFDLKRLHFGFTVGLNLMDFGFDRNWEADSFLYADISKVQPGFQVSMVSDLRLADNLNLRFMPGISFGAREIVFYDPAQNYAEVDYPDANSKVRVGPAFLDFPLHLKWRSKRDNNYRPYLVGGLNFRYDMAAKKEYDGDTQDYMKLNRADLYLELGFGVDTYLKYFKFAPEIKVGMGLNNMMSDEPRPGHPEFTNSIAALRSYIVMLNFHFE